MDRRSRTYDQLCPVAISLDTLGDRWAILLIRDLLWHGPLSYTDLAQFNPGISPTQMSNQLAHLTKAGLVEKIATPIRPQSLYKLTSAGQSAGPIIDALYAFGAPLLPHTPLTPDKLDYVLMLAINNGGAASWELSKHNVRLKVDDATFLIALGPGFAKVGPDGAHDALIQMDQSAFMATIAGADTPTAIAIAGNADAAGELLSLLPLAST